MKTAFWITVIFILVSLFSVLTLRWVNPSSSAVITLWELQNHRNAKHIWVSIDKISPTLQIAVIASEDQKFPAHFGFDIESLKKALAEKRSRPRGASTITQQVAKNLFLWNGRSYIRKGLEAWFTLLMECLWPKERILEVYLNIAEFGEGIYGAEAAAKNFYNISAISINQWQATLLAAVLPSPKKMSAQKPSAYVQSRATEISRSISNLGGTGYLREL